MRTSFLIAGSVILFSFGCSSNNTGNGSGTGAGFDDGQRSDSGSGSTSATPGSGDACAQYLKCVGDAEPDALPAALAAYGPKGSCWGGGASLDATCENACTSSMATESASHLGVASCGSPALLTMSGASAACNACMTTTCSTPNDVCVADPQCVDLFNCYDACQPAGSTGIGEDTTPATEACEDACVKKAGETTAANEFNQLGDCVDVQCGSTCSGTGNSSGTGG